MKIVKLLLSLFLFFIIAESCSKKTVDPPPVVTLVPERLEMTPLTSSISIGGTVQYALKFFNNTGVEAAVPTGIVWSVLNTAIATTNQQGLVTGNSAGQTEVTAKYNAAIIKTLITVVANNTQLATINITPATTQEIKLISNLNLIAEGKNNVGGIISGLTFAWQTDSPTFTQISNTGLLTPTGYGTANITASSLGITSAPLMVQVIRNSPFVGSGSTGMAKLKIENSQLKLQTTSDFSVSTGAPDLRIYLGNNSNNVTGAVQVGVLSQRSGAQSWNVASPTTIIQYRYVIVWCAQFGGTYGVADLGN
jgi:hypothetical protein